MERVRVTRLESGRHPLSCPPSPAPQSPSPRGCAGLRSLESRRLLLRRGRQGPRHVRGPLRPERCRGQLAAPCRAQVPGDHRRAGRAHSQQLVEHLGLTGRGAGASQRARRRTRGARRRPAGPQAERHLEPSTGDPERACRPRGRDPRTPGMLDHGRRQLAQATRLRGAPQRTTVGLVRVRSRVTLVHSSSARSSTSRVASRVWNPNSCASVSSSSMIRPW